MRRDDLISKVYGGNKFYKLYYNLLNARQLAAKTIVSFGGAYSNHLHALAAVGSELKLKTVGIVRSYANSPATACFDTPTMIDAKAWGMQLLGLNKNDYQRKDISALLPILNTSNEIYHLIPEGGENLAGVRGCTHLGYAIEKQLHSMALAKEGNVTVCCASGTGATLAGLCASLPEAIQCLGFSVLKGQDRLSAKVERWLQLLGTENNNWKVISGYHHGGYGRVSPELISFIQGLEQDNDCLLDPVYTGKMLWGIRELASQGYWKPGTHVVAIHSGGIQGRRGFDLETPDHFGLKKSCNSV
jgi:1-aminocyclopropane-1-carboxylate deaminase